MNKALPLSRVFGQMRIIKIKNLGGAKVWEREVHTARENHPSRNSTAQHSTPHHTLLFYDRTELEKCVGLEVVMLVPAIKLVFLWAAAGSAAGEATE